ncbi:uncharacterized protein LOC117173561 [Belonocnema kinseyi]|uniref:uncharacterized protein LOC117173561 n=1 Tax=Belonocnema kinseyi TaxID=2817044 RepID=UPI00143D807D|nr:uncharacterized protein LOC117173561 [Belonocnema kinseyi]
MKIGNDVSILKYYGDSETLWLKYIQSQLFYNEISILDRKIELDRNSPLLTLNPFLDENKILRVGGRLANAAIEFNRKFSIIIKAHPLVTLLIRYFHRKCLHGETQLTLSLLRQNFQLIRGRQTVKSVIYKCIPCAPIRADISNELMGALPKNRTTRLTRHFTHVGIDYAGPVQVTIHRGREYKSHSGNIAVFICFATRAIYLELVSDYTTEAFLVALKRFVSRRGYLTRFTVIEGRISKVLVANVTKLSKG